MAATLAAALRNMVRLYRAVESPFIASITKDGKVNLRFPKK